LERGKVSFKINCRRCSEYLRGDQFGFRKGAADREAIAVMRTLVDKNVRNRLAKRRKCGAWHYIRCRDTGEGRRENKMRAFEMWAWKRTEKMFEELRRISGEGGVGGCE
jgi:hypothetical protein